MRIPMLHAPSATRPVSSLIGESSATVQTAIYTNEAPKHVPRANVKSSQYINKERPTHISHLGMEGIANQLSPNKHLHCVGLLGLLYAASSARGVWEVSFIYIIRV